MTALMLVAAIVCGVLYAIHRATDHDTEEDWWRTW